MLAATCFVLLAVTSAKIDSKPDGCPGRDDPDIVNPPEDCPDIDPAKELDPKKFQGDIDNIPLEGTAEERNMAIDQNSRWPKSSDGLVYVPYEHDSTMSSRGRQAVNQAVADFDANTCIRFRPRRGESDYIEFVRASGCYSSMGRTGGRQALSLGGGCESKGTAIHEMIHALGFLHEQARPDRDSYITILWQNIQPGREGQFTKGDTAHFTTLGTRYEYSSLMHYPGTAFSKDGVSPTMTAKDARVRSLGQRLGFTQLDIQKVNKLYNCGQTGVITRRPTVPVEIRTNPPVTPNTGGGGGGGNGVCRDASGTGNCLRRIRERSDLCESRSKNLCLKSCGLC